PRKNRLSRGKKAAAKTRPAKRTGSRGPQLRPRNPPKLKRKRTPVHDQARLSGLSARKRGGANLLSQLRRASRSHRTDQGKGRRSRCRGADTPASQKDFPAKSRTRQTHRDQAWQDASGCAL